MTLWQDARMLNSMANALIMVALAAFASTSVWWLAHRPLFELNDIEIAAVEGRELERVSLADLHAARLNVIDGNFFTIDLQAVRQRFESAPWVRRAEVRRVWPNRLHVAIEEHRPLAYWADGRLVNTFGELFAADVKDPAESAELLRFAGPEGTQRMVTQRYDELEKQLRKLSLRPQEVALSDRQAWSALLDNGITLLIGRDEGMAVMDRVARWAAVHPMVQAKLNERTEVIDLRYPNGFAVRAPGSLDNDPDFKHRKDSSKRP